MFAHATEIAERSATLRVQSEIVNASEAPATVTVVHELRDAVGQVVASDSTAVEVAAGASVQTEMDLQVVHAIRWTLERPYLYELETRIESGTTLLDQTQFKTGFRTLEFSADHGFSLNGQNLKVKGVCLHHDAGVLGSAVPREVWRKRLQTLKSIGTNAIRTSHNPQATDLYELCDELGLLVMNEAFDEWEFPKRKWLDGWNVGEPGFEGSYDFFEEWAERDLADMVRRDRNHISIFTWSIGNEVDYPNDPYSHPALDGSAISQPMFGGYQPDQPDANRLGVIAKKLVAVVKQHDTSRPVTAALAGVVMSNQTDYPFALDIVGYNYSEDRYAIDHETYPDRVIYGSENRHDYPAWRAVMDHDYIFGQFLWTGIDYLGESGRWPSRGFYSGLMDFGGFLKPRGHFREALWSDEPVLHLGTMPVPERDYLSVDAWPIWNYQPGERVRVLCYTNASEVQLLLNGEPVGERKPYDPETGILHWDVSFATGTLEAVGYDKQGREVSRDQILTHGEAEALQLRSDTTTIDAGRGLAMVELQIVDADGNRIMDATHEVTCHIEGPARLLGLEASNNQDMSDYTDATHNVYHGRILAYVEATGEPGEVKVRFSAQGFESVELTLKSVASRPAQLQVVPALTQPEQHGVPAEAERTAYLMTYFKDETHSLYLATSSDGFSFTDVNGGEPVLLGRHVAEQQGVRDPHIQRGPDGAFYLCLTDLHIYAQREGLRNTQWERPGELYDWGNNRALVFMKSWDLVHWTHSLVHVGELFPEFADAGCFWAPQTVWDEDEGKLMVYFTTRIGRGPNFMVYAYADEAFTTLVSKPEVLLHYPNPKINTIDADITRVGDTYHLFYVAHEPPGGIRHATSETMHRDYQYLPERVDAAGVACEGPNLWYRKQTNSYILMYDIFGVDPHNMGFSETTDFETFRNVGRFNEVGSPMKATNFTSPKHGSVLAITQEELERVREHFQP
ncbi:MAG: glycoside hydrolase family 2 TIM barrel-domain containing protein [Puniceicoccaceae bacterium]